MSTGKTIRSEDYTQVAARRGQDSLPGILKEATGSEDYKIRAFRDYETIISEHHKTTTRSGTT